MHSIKYFVFIFLVFWATLLAQNNVFAAELSINLIAVNSSEAETKEKDVKFYLPKELEPSDVLDSGELKIEYDVDKNQYFVKGKFTFSPKESKNFKIRVNDVWVISAEEISVLKQNMDGNLKILESNEKLYPNAKLERDKTFEKLDTLLVQQQSLSDSIERRIEHYRAYTDIVAKIRNKVYDPKYLEKEGQAQDLGDEGKTIKMILEVRNPSTTEEKTVKHKHSLPVEIHEEDVIDKQGFEVRFNDKKEKPYLAKEELFKPGETKKYEIIFRDVWRFSVNKLDPMQERATLAIDELKGTYYATPGQYLYDQVIRDIDLIRETQNRELPPDEHIGIFRTNETRFENVKQAVERIEQMSAIIKAQKLEEFEASKVKNVLKKLQALRGLASLSEAVLKKGITVTTTWRIIGGSIIFLAFFTGYHFFVWAGRSAKKSDTSPLKPGEEIAIVPKPTAPKKEA